MSLLEVRDYTFGYQKNNLILKGISFEVEPEQCFCIFGPNGCGKSTLLNCIIGISKPASGKLFLDHEDAEYLSLTQKAKKIAYVSQKSERTFPYTVEQIVLMGRTAYSSPVSSPKKEDLEIVHDALKSVGMDAFRDCSFTQLSGGETQLVKIARAIAQNTDIIVFDEPTSHLDFCHELQVLNDIIKVVRTKKISLIMATHFPNHAYFLEDHGINTKVALMENGCFRSVGTPSQVLNQKNMEEIFGVKTKILEYEERGKKNHYMIPLDFTESSRW